MVSLVDKLHPLVLNVGLAVHNADWNWKNVNSPFTRLYYITEGTAQIQLSGSVQILKPNYLYFIPAFTIHSYIAIPIFAITTCMFMKSINQIQIYWMSGNFRLRYLPES